MRIIVPVGQDEVVVGAEEQHGGGEDEHDHHPRLADAEVFDEDAGQIDQPARGNYLGNVVEGSLPTNPSGLFVVGERRHIDTVGGNVVGGTAQGDNGKHGYADGEERGQLQGERHAGEHESCDDLRQHDKVFLGFVDFEERAPQGFECPGQHDDAGPEGNLRIAHAHALVHE